MANEDTSRKGQSQLARQFQSAQPDPRALTGSELVRAARSVQRWGGAFQHQSY